MKKYCIALFSLACFVILEPSCQKIDTTDLGVDLIPTVDNVNTFDTTLDVITAGNAYLPDSTTVSRAEDHGLGVLEDPEFGRTTATIYFDVLPTGTRTYPFINKDSISIDSVVLSLGYVGMYGDSTSLEKISVYEISQSADLGDSLYPISTPDFPTSATLLGEKEVDFTKLNDQQEVWQDTGLVTVRNQLRIHLDPALGERFKNYDTSNAFKSDSMFREFFRGLAITADSVSSPRKRALAYFNLADNSQTRLLVYYRTVNAGKPDTTFTEFVHKNQVGRGANIVRRNVAGSNYAANISDNGSLKEKLYIQSSPGSYATIAIPGLEQLSNRLVHKAELIMEKVPSAEDNIFTEPGLLFMDLIDSANKRFLTIKNDMIHDGQTFNFTEFGGIPKNGKYSFDLSRHVQGIVSRNEQVYTLRLYAPFETQPSYVQRTEEGGAIVPFLRPVPINPFIAHGRVVLGGGSHPSNRMRLRIIYSRI